MNKWLLVFIGALLAALLALWVVFQPPAEEKRPDCIKYQDTVPC